MQNMEKCETKLYYKFFHIWYCAYVLNLIVQDGLNVIKSTRETIKYLKVSPQDIIILQLLQVTTLKFNLFYVGCNSCLQKIVGRYSMEAPCFLWLVKLNDGNK